MCNLFWTPHSSLEKDNVLSKLLKTVLAQKWAVWRIQLRTKNIYVNHHIASHRIINNDVSFPLQVSHTIPRCSRMSAAKRYLTRYVIQLSKLLSSRSIFPGDCKRSVARLHRRCIE